MKFYLLTESDPSIPDNWRGFLSLPPGGDPNPKSDDLAAFGACLSTRLETELGVGHDDVDPRLVVPLSVVLHAMKDADELMDVDG